MTTIAQRSKARWRERVRAIRPLADEGIDWALKEYYHLTHRNHKKTRCTFCGAPIRSQYDSGRCTTHQRSRLSMREQLAE